MNEDDNKLTDGIALCLSGGGYRAMVFHLGALIRLNEAGLLSRLDRVSSVSGGSITAACLGQNWNELGFGADGRAANLGLVVDAIRGLASITIDAGAILFGVLLPGTISDRVADAYAKHLFGEATLQDLPDAAPGLAPRFVINATNIQTGSLWRFSKPYMADYQVGLVPNPTVRLAEAVAASSAFPPVLSPHTLSVAGPYDPETPGRWTAPDFRESVVLSDGGVYDNLGLETAFKRYRTLLVSDGGGKIAPQAEPPSDWARHSLRILDIIDNQVRSLRMRQLVAAYEACAIDPLPDFARNGAFWTIRTDFTKFQLADDPLGCAGRDPVALAQTPTRLEALDAALQEKLINWGYAVCDGALRRYFSAALQQQYNIEIAIPKGFPYEGGY